MLVVKNPLPANVGNARDTGLIPGSGRFPEEGNGSPLRYSCLENPTDSGAWWAIVLGVVNGRTRLSTAGGRAYMVNDFSFLQEVAFTNKNSELFAH